MNDDYLLYTIKEIDLHGLNRFEAKIQIEGFIHEQHSLGEKYIGIIHGIGTGILKQTTYEVLKNNQYVKEFKIDLFNNGRTIVELKHK